MNNKNTCKSNFHTCICYVMIDKECLLHSNGENNPSCICLQLNKNYINKKCPSQIH